MNTTIQARIDIQSKKEAEAILGKMGMSLNEGIRIFLHQVIQQRALPFRPVVNEDFNEETRQALMDARDRKNLKTYQNVDDFMDALR